MNFCFGLCVVMLFEMWMRGGCCVRKFDWLVCYKEWKYFEMFDRMGSCYGMKKRNINGMGVGCG